MSDQDICGYCKGPRSRHGLFGDNYVGHAFSPAMAHEYFEVAAQRYRRIDPAEFEKAHAESLQAAEHQRLKDAVVATAKEWLRGQEVRGERQYIAVEVYLVRAIEALEMFENDNL